MSVTGRAIARRPRTVRRVAGRVVAAVLLASIAFVPSLARVHDRIEHQRTPAQEHSRFRWTNSCESVPQKIASVVAVAPLDGPAQTTIDAAAHVWRRMPTVTPRPASSLTPSPRPLRAPPAIA